MQAESVPQARQQSQQQQAESRGMAHDMELWRNSSEGAKWQQDRARLPVLMIRQDLLTQLADHDVVVVSGDTGCGKTTQVMLACTPSPDSVWLPLTATAVGGLGLSLLLDMAALEFDQKWYVLAQDRLVLRPLDATVCTQLPRSTRASKHNRCCYCHGSSSTVVVHAVATSQWMQPP